MRIRRIAAAAGALVALLALLIVPPLLLIAGVGNPLPTWQALRSGDINDVLLLHLLACLVWIAWAQFAAGTVLEAAAANRGSGLPRRIAIGQGLSRTLITLIITATALAPFVGAITNARATPSLPAATASQIGSSLASAVTTTSQSTNTQSDVVSYVVGSDPATTPTLWSIAESTLGDPLRWREIWGLNQNRVMLDGRTFTDPDTIRVGWELHLPAGASVVPRTNTTTGLVDGHVDTVHPGDTLSSIAEAEYGDANAYPAISVANQGRVEPNGRVFGDPSKIWPGWTIEIPQQGVPTIGRDSPRPTTVETMPPATSADPNTPSSSASPPTVPPPGSPAPTEPNEQVSPTVDAPNRHTSRSDEGGIGLPIAVVGGSTLLAALSIAELRRRRRRQARHRHPGRAIAQPPPRLQKVERSLMSAPQSSDVEFFDTALRSLVSLRSSTPHTGLPSVVAAKLGSEQLELLLDDRLEPPPPWTITEDGRRWHLLRKDLPPADPTARSLSSAPYPALASVGTDADGAAWMIDLELTGSIAIAGPRTQRQGMLRYLAAELAHNSWSEQLQISLFGVGREMSALMPGRLRSIVDLASAVAAIRAQLADVNRVLHEVDTDVLGGRLDNVAADAWMPHVLLVDTDDPAEIELLQPLLTDIATGVRRTIAVVITSTSLPALVRCTASINEAGELAIPSLGLTLTSFQVPAEEAADLAALLTLAADTSDRPTPVSRTDRPADIYADAVGGVRPEVAERLDAISASAEPNAVATVDSMLPLSDDVYVDQTATTAADLGRLSPNLPEPARTTLAFADTELDADLLAWRDPGSDVPKLHLLGPVNLAGLADAPGGRAALLTEIVAYLLTRPFGATVEQLATDIWPHIPDAAAKTTPRQTVSMTRQWLGLSSRTGRERLPRALADAGGARAYRINDVLVDADLFRRLRLRGTGHGADGIDDLRSALDLVTGEPFDQHRPGGYGWLAETALDHEYTAMIIDVAHIVATHDLAAGDPIAAAAAAQAALRTNAGDDVALLDMLAAAKAQGHDAEATTYLRRILANHDADVEEDLPPRTYEVLLRHGWLS